MDFLLATIIFSAIGLFVVAKFMIWITSATARVAITDHFQAAEFILEHHKAPEVWVKAPGLFSSILVGRNPLKALPKVFRIGESQNEAEVGKTRVLRRLDGLVAFFETCPFFEDEETRSVMLQELATEREAWEKKSLEEIIQQAGRDGSRTAPT